MWFYCLSLGVKLGTYFISKKIVGPTQTPQLHPPPVIEIPTPILLEQLLSTYGRGDVRTDRREG